LIALLFFVSGALALAYQTLWARQLLDFIGVSAWSYATVLAAFMGGLALGGALFGPRADRSRRPLRLYALLEAGLGLYALAFPAIAAGMERLYGAWVSGGYSGGADALPVKGALSAAALLVPTTLMGGTYPALLRHATVRLELLGRQASGLYAVNAAGAVLGALALPFLVVPALGMRRSLLLLALGNGLLAAVALLLSARAGDAAPAASPDAPERPAEMQTTRLVLALILVEGFAAFALETAWIRYFSLVLGSSTYSLAVMLAAFIAGIALGTACLRALDGRVREPLRALGTSQALAGLLLLLPLPLYPYGGWLVANWGAVFSREAVAFPFYESGKLALAFLVMLGPTFFIGMAVPLAVKAACGDVAHVGRDAGRVYASNTVGNVAGALAGGLLLLPLLGMERLLRLAGALHLGLGSFLMLRGRGRATLAAGAAGLLLAIGGVVGPSLWAPRWFTVNPGRRHESWVPLATTRQILSRMRVDLSVDDPAAHLTVFSTEAPGGPLRRLAVNAKVDASSDTDMPTQILSAHVPLLLHGSARRVLVIGLASGVTCGSALAHPLESLDVVDVVAAMPRAARLFESWNRGAMDDPRLRVHIDDARSFVMHSGRQWDVVVSEPSNPWMAGTGGLFSRDFYLRAARAVAEGGLYLQWVQTYEMGDATFASIVASFRSVFPYVYGFQASRGDLLLIGAAEALRPDWQRSRARMAEPAVAEDLGRLGIGDLESLLAFQALSPVTVEYVAARADRLNDDDNLLLEHRAPRELFEKHSSRLASDLDERLHAGAALFVNELPPPSPQVVAATLGERRVRQERVAGAFEAAARWSRATADPEPELGRGVEELLARGRAEEAATLLESRAPSILWTLRLSPNGARFWRGRLDGWLDRLSPAAPPKLRALGVEALMASGSPHEALAAIDAWASESPGPPAEWAVLRSCEIDPGDACERALQQAIERGGPPELERLQELRRRQPVSP
jgi:spermidine synthase